MKFGKCKIESFRRTIAVLALILVVGVSVTGCMGRDDNTVVEKSVNEGRITQSSPSPDYMPQGMANSSAAPDSADAFDWAKRAAEVEGKIAQLSEISEARIVVEGNTALVAVKFSQAYQGEMTERIREMVAAEVMRVDPKITTVAVTADEEDVKGVYELSDSVLAGTPLEQLRDRINEIVRNATTLR